MDPTKVEVFSCGQQRRFTLNNFILTFHRSSNYLTHEQTNESTKQTTDTIHQLSCFPTKSYLHVQTTYEAIVYDKTFVILATNVTHFF